MSRHKNSKSFAGLSVLAVGAMYLINQSVSDSATVKNILKPASGEYYKSKFGKIYYQVTGKGTTPLLLLHDAAPYSSAYEWKYLIDSLKADYKIYTIDLLGCGRSDKPGITYTNYLYVQLIRDFISNIIGQPTVLAASGLSASFAVTAARSDEELISSLIMINPHSLSFLKQVPDEKAKILRAIMSIPVLGTTVYNIFMNKRRLEYELMEDYFYNPFKVHKSFTDASYEAAHLSEGNGRFFLASLDGRFLFWDIERTFASLKQPVLLVYGEKLQNERVIARSYQKLKKNVSVCPILAGKMMPQIECPEAVADAIKNFA